MILTIIICSIIIMIPVYTILYELKRHKDYKDMMRLFLYNNIIPNQNQKFSVNDYLERINKETEKILLSKESEEPYTIIL